MRTLSMAGEGQANGSGRGGLLGAVRFAVDVMREHPELVIAPVAGGRAALVVSRPVVTVLSGRPEGPSVRGVEGWLARRQTRRSRLVYAADRDTAVAFALKWRLDLSRIRLAGEGTVTPELVKRELPAGRKGIRSWHST
jgi:hypothetical protein